MELHRRRGAPNGNKNRLKHGRYSSAAIAQRKLVRETLRSARRAMLLAKLELAGVQVAHGQEYVISLHFGHEQKSHSFGSQPELLPLA